MKCNIHNVPIPLELETRPAVDTTAAANYLLRRPQTLRAWACFENGPIRPIRINGRLAWPVSEIRRLLGCAPFPKATKRQESSNTESAAIAMPTTQGEKE